MFMGSPSNMNRFQPSVVTVAAGHRQAARPFERRRARPLHQPETRIPGLMVAETVIERI